MSMIKNKFYSVRLPADVGDALRQVATENTRTLAAQILHYVKLGLASENQTKGKENFNETTI